MVETCDTKFQVMKKLLFGSIICLSFGCNKGADNQQAPSVALKNQSNAPAFVEMFPDFQQVNVFTLLSTGDTIQGSPNFVYGGAPDGQGFLKNPDGSGYVMVTNHENTYAISRVYLDKQMKPVKGEYIVDTDGGMFRLCSGSLATPEEHGFPRNVFLSTGESNVNAMTHAIDVLGAAQPKDQTRVKPALGKFSGENAVPLHKDAYPGKTVVILGEDAGNGQVYLYVSNTPGDLDNGKLYVLRRTDGNQIETAMTKGTTYNVEFAEVPNAKNLTGAEIEALMNPLKAIQFARVEDLDYRKGGGTNSRDLYFVATGMAGTTEKTYWGRMYRLILDATNPLIGKLSVVADGADDPGKDIINPDNLCATENYVYIQEDGDSFFPGASHNSWIWQYNIQTGVKKPFMEMKNRTFGGSKYNPTNDQRFGLWEHGAMVDISDIIGVKGAFTINIHAHSWVEGDKFLNPSKANSVQSYKSGGQTLIITNVPK
jgi:hypothetical protein